MIGQTISHYNILEKLGEGGMGVVYKAQDTTLDRLVALKFLPPHLSASEDDKARFIQEAKSAAALNHPNICTIYGVEESAYISQGGASADKSEGKMFIAMEYVEGQTLREKGMNIPLKLSIEIGAQIAEGLAVAHEKGIVHRDIKPENIMIQKDGRVRIMDFGLAKLKGASRLTRVGSTVGTLGYMSPEQVRGEDSDHRTDIFSLGVILYEIIAGQSPFKGVHETAIMYEIVNVDPQPISTTKPEIDPELDAIVLDCMAKEPIERYQSVAELARNLRRFKRESSRQRVSRVTGARPAMSASQIRSSAQIPEMEQEESRLQKMLPSFLRRRPWMILSILLLFVSGVLGYFYLEALSTPRMVTRSFILAPEGTAFNNAVGGHLALSPDGKTLAFVATDSVGKDQLWIRALNSLSALPLPGTGGAQYPFWSYESKSIAFFADGKLKRIDAAGGPVTTICDASDGRGGSWNQAGMIIFAPTSTSGIHQVAAAGGQSVAMTKLDTVKKETSHRWPCFLPDGKHFVFTTQVGGGSNEGAINAATIGDSSTKQILALSSNAEFTNGYLTYVRQNNLIAHPFDASRLEFTGDPIPIAERVVYGEARSRSIFSFSQNGVLVYQSGSTRPPGVFLVDRNGKILSQLKASPVAFGARFSGDGKRILLDSYDVPSRNFDIWLHDVARSFSTRFTFDPGIDMVPLFSPDGNQAVFSSNRLKSQALFLKNLSGMNNEELLFNSSLDDYATSWSPDGKSLLLSVQGDPKTKWDMLLLPLTGEKKPIPLAQSEFDESLGVFSPDGRWVAYQSNESGKYEVYVRTLDPRGGKRQVSNAGGTGPKWPRKTNEIIYTSADSKVMSAVVKYTANSFEVVRTTTLFDLNIKGVGTCYDVTADGQTFLIQLTGMEGSSTPATLVMNWQEELKKK
jgi:serine/threonine protein kinase/WD40 repeat protein